VINDILDFSKIEAGKLEVDRIPFSLRDMVEETMKMLAVRADEKGLELACRIAPEITGALLGDPDRVRQILVNLVGNGIKFTSKGEVVVEVVEESHAEKEVTLRFSVRDTGIGIPDDKLGIIFEAFAQADTSTTRQYGGTGLGLAIASRLSEVMGGHLWAESELGKGSVFHFTARFGKQDGTSSQEAAARERESVNLIDLPVLVVDDNATNRRILEEILTKWAMRPTSVDSGPLALDVLHKARVAGEPYALVLLDVHMPGMDGFEVAQRIKQTHNLSGATVMMLTSATRPGDIHRCKELGVAAYLIKPVRRTELLEAMLSALGERAAEPGPVRVSSHRSVNERRRGVRILLAEDNPVNQTVALRLLTKYGHRVVVAGNGREALLALEKAPLDGFDLILMDVQMPEMDGFAATAAVREREKETGSHIPIVAMTAHAMKGDRERCLAAGMDDYISKPIQAKALLDLIERLTGVPAPGAPSGSPSAEAHEPDLKAMVDVFEGDMGLVNEIVHLFLRDCPHQCDLIREGLARGHRQIVERTAHTLKGSVSNFAFPAAFYNLQKLENLGREGDLGEAAELFAAVEAQLETLQSSLASFQKEQVA
jgi:CheY-like chemotaxis protein